MSVADPAYPVAPSFGAPTAAPSESAAPARVPAKYWCLEWGLSFGVLLCLLTIVATGGKTLLPMLALLGVYGAAFWKRSLKAVLPTLPLLALPALALMSVLWSDNPSGTLRFGLQFAITVAAALLIARRTPGAALLGSLFCALLAACVLSALFGAYVPLGVGGQTAFVGVFGSKNELAMVASLCLLGGVSVTLDGRQPGVMRIVGILGAALGAYLLFKSRSAGAAISTVVGLGFLLSLFVLTFAGFKARGWAAAGVALAILPLAVAADPMRSEAERFMVQVLGKDPTLTGRTYLWQRAGEYVADRPALGHGYQAFWRQGNLEAEGLWRFGKIQERAGFNFHNQYIEVLVDLGVLGLIVFVACLIAGFLGLAGRTLARPTPTLVFASAVFLWLVARTPVESVTLVQFGIATLMLFVTLAIGLGGERRSTEL